LRHCHERWANARRAIRHPATHRIVREEGIDIMIRKKLFLGKLARIIDGLVAMVPEAIGGIVRIFTTPVLRGIVGPVTKFVLEKLRTD
jgi:hypothetical protein